MNVGSGGIVEEGDQCVIYVLTLFGIKHVGSVLLFVIIQIGMIKLFGNLPQIVQKQGIGKVELCVQVRPMPLDLKAILVPNMLSHLDFMGWF